MKRKLLSIFIVCIMSFICTIGLISCNKDDAGNTDKNNNEIALTLDNYKYYLTITNQLKSSGNYAGGTYRIASYDVYISGAIIGIYQNCVLHLKNGSTVQLNASGNAQTTKSIVNGEDSFVVVGVEGKILLY